MKEEFSPEEIKQIVGAARVWAPGFSQEQLQKMIGSQSHLGELGFCEAAWGMVRLEQERGVPCTEAIDAYLQLLKDNSELEKKAASVQAKLKAVEEKVRLAEDRLHQIEEATERVKAQRDREEKGLTAFKRMGDKEKRRIERDLEQCRQEANVSKEEIITAGQLKAEVAKHGFSLDLALGLSQEFAGHEDIMEELAEALKEGQTLTRYNEQAEERKQVLQDSVEGLEGERRQLGSKLCQLRADTAFEEELRRFYHRYQGLGELMDHLATWRSIFFVRCNNPLYAVTGAFNWSTSGARFWTEKPPLKRCPCCNYPDAAYDETLYQDLNLVIGAPLKIKLGE